jgi:lactoylglutathione lyase
MITRVGTVSLFVNDQEKAKDFYTRILGFELKTDVSMGPDARWVAVAPKGAETEVVLYKPDENWAHYKQVVGQSQALTFEVVDVAGTIAALKAQGVRVVQEPDAQPWGTYAIILDTDDNRLLLVEQPQG